MRQKQLVNEDYSDGEIEDRLLSFFESPEYMGKRNIDQFLDIDSSWASIYHLSPARKNILSWYDFDSKAELLEVGAGCGALTELFCDRVANVTANELTQKRANILKARLSHKTNLSVQVGNIQNMTFKNKFKYITSIGVLEWIGKSISMDSSGDDPHLNFLVNLKSHLTSDGSLIIAIENRFGLKYWAGCPEDHTGKLFDSLENYPDPNNRIKTYSKIELSNLLKKAGFNTIYFYYPFPDYKLPNEIFSEDYLPNQNHSMRFGNLTGLQDKAQILFNQDRVMEGLINNNQFEFFSNSFLVFAS